MSLKYLCTTSFAARLVRQVFQNKRGLSTKLTAHQASLMARGLPKKENISGVEYVVVVASGKGGVGKSTVAVNFAVSLANMGKNVGLLDGDIFGPSVPLLMNVHSQPLVNKNNLMIPPMNYGVKCLSMGMLTPIDGAVIWRGPLVMSAIHRLLKGAEWKPLDVLVIDTPPGTGDVLLSLAQNTPITGVILVSTPQAAAMEVTMRGANMFQKLKIPILGIVENMRFSICSHCKQRNDLFRTTTADFMRKTKTELLASLPLDAHIAECCEIGVPVVTKFPDSVYGKCFEKLAQDVFSRLENSKRDAAENK